MKCKGSREITQSNPRNQAWHKLFCKKPSFVDKKLDEKKFGELSTEEIQEIKDHFIPVTAKKPYKVWN